jgi:hypothetical protein
MYFHCYVFEFLLLYLCILIVMYVLCILFHCVVLYIVCVLKYTVLLPPGMNPIAVNKYIIPYRMLLRGLWLFRIALTRLSRDSLYVYVSLHVKCLLFLSDFN